MWFQDSDEWATLNTNQFQQVPRRSLPIHRTSILPTSHLPAALPHDDINPIGSEQDHQRVCLPQISQFPADQESERVNEPLVDYDQDTNSSCTGERYYPGSLTNTSPASLSYSTQVNPTNVNTDYFVDDVNQRNPNTVPVQDDTFLPRWIKLGLGIPKPFKRQGAVRNRQFSAHPHIPLPHPNHNSNHHSRILPTGSSLISLQPQPPEVPDRGERPNHRRSHRQILPRPITLPNPGSSSSDDTSSVSTDSLYTKLTEWWNRRQSLRKSVDYAHPDYGRISEHDSLNYTDHSFVNRLFGLPTRRRGKGKRFYWLLMINYWKGVIVFLPRVLKHFHGPSLSYKEESNPPD